MMKIRQTGVFLLLMIIVWSAGSALAAPWKGGRGSGGWGMGGAYQRLYDPGTVETITGTVVSVDKITPMKGMSYGVHLLVKTDHGNVPVHLGPGWFLERLDANIAKGDRLEVTGSKVTFQGIPTIIAKELKKGDEVLRLRDDNGNPEWAGWRRK